MGRFCFLHREDKEYLVDDDGVIRSIENLRQLQNVKWVVLSLGGNVPWEATRRGGMNFVKTWVQTNGREKGKVWVNGLDMFSRRIGCHKVVVTRETCQLYFLPGDVTSQDWLRDCTSLCALPL